MKEKNQIHYGIYRYPMILLPTFHSKEKERVLSIYWVKGQTTRKNDQIIQDERNNLRVYLQESWKREMISI